MILDKTIRKLIAMKGKTHRLRKNIGIIKRPHPRAKAGKGFPSFEIKNKLRNRMRTVGQYRCFSGLI